MTDPTSAAEAVRQSLIYAAAVVVCDLDLRWSERAVEAGETVANLELSQAIDALRALVEAQR